MPGEIRVPPVDSLEPLLDDIVGRLLPGGHFFEGPASDVLVASLSAELLVHMSRKEMP
jgi:hypothetical protein